MSEIKLNQPEGDDNRIIVPDEDGNEHLFEILFTFDVDSTETSYMVLAPEGTNEDESEEVEVHAFRYEEEGEELSLFPIETEEEWEMVEELLNTFTDPEE